MILVVDNSPEIARTHVSLLKSIGFDARFITQPTEVENELSEHPEIDLVLLDLCMPERSGLDVLNSVHVRFPRIGIIMATVVNDIEHAVRAIKRGAYNYLLKPIEQLRLREVILSYYQNKPQSVINDPRFSSFVTAHRPFEQIFQRVLSFAGADVPVLIQGETGTGKELIAQLIHSVSKRKDGPFVPVNISAIPSELFEAEMFGYLKGTFTGASHDRHGYFEIAKNGTLFLDEIGEMEPREQKKLLRTLQSYRFSRLGEHIERPLQCRVVLATNKDLAHHINDDSFRSDLYYRISSHTITLPPLRHRKEDVHVLASFFLKKYNSQYGRQILGFDKKALDALSSYEFPGNVRELEGYISAAVLLETSRFITVESLPALLRNEDLHEEDENLLSMRIKTVKHVLAECDGNQTLAAKKLGISRTTLYRMMKDDLRSRTDTVSKKGFNF